MVIRPRRTTKLSWITLTMGARPFNDTEGRYCHFVGRWPDTCRVDATWAIEVSTCDADDPPVAWPGPRGFWDRYIAQNDLWYRNSAGQRVRGWGTNPARWATDLGRRGSSPWPRVIRECRNLAVGNGAIPHFDDIGIRPWRSDYPHPERWRANVLTFPDELPGPVSFSAIKAYFTPPELVRKFKPESIVKMEGVRWRRFQHRGWSGPPEDPYTWQEWFCGDGRGRIYNVCQMLILGFRPLLEATVDLAWSQARQDAYALMVVATVCLVDGAMLAYHGLKGWDKPIWTRAHEKAWRLDAPIGPAELTTKGIWVREFRNGRVTVNPTARPAGNVAAHSASIMVK